MKTLFLTIFIFSCSLAGFSQSTDSKVGSVTLPEGNEKIDADALKAHIQKKFKGDEMAASGIGGKGTVYKIGDVLVWIKYDDGNVEEGYMAERKKGLDAIYRGNSTYSSAIKTVNNDNILITNHTSNEIGYHDIYTYNATRTKFITIRVEHNIADSAKAQNVVQHIINHIRFAN